MADQRNQYQPTSASLGNQPSCSAQSARDSGPLTPLPSEMRRAPPTPSPRNFYLSGPVQNVSQGTQDVRSMRVSQQYQPNEDLSLLAELNQSLVSMEESKRQPPSMLDENGEGLFGRGESQVSLGTVGMLAEMSLSGQKPAKLRLSDISSSRTSTDTAIGTEDTLTEGSALHRTHPPQPKPRITRRSDSDYSTAGAKPVPGFKAKPSVSAPVTPIVENKTPAALPPYRQSQSENLTTKNDGGITEGLVRELQRNSPAVEGGNQYAGPFTPPTGRDTGARQKTRPNKTSSHAPVVPMNQLHQIRSDPSIYQREEEKHKQNYQILFRRAELKEKQDKLSEALDDYQMALIYEKEDRGDNHIEVAKTFRIIGRLCRKLSKNQEAVEYIQQALQICKVCHQSVDSDLLWNMHDELAQAYASIDINKEIENYERAIEILYMSTDVPPERLAHMHNNVGVSYHKVGKFEESKRHLLRAKEMMGLVVADRLETAKVHISLGDLYKDTGEHDLAIREYKECLRIDGINKNESSASLSASVNNSLASIYEAKGDSEQARIHRQAAQQTMKELKGDGEEEQTSAGPVGTAAVKAVSASQKEVDMAQKFHSEQEYLQCIEHYQKALEVLTSLEDSSRDSESVMQQQALIHNNIGNAYRTIRRLPEAKEHLQEALRLRRFLYSNLPNEQTASTLFNLGYTFSQTRDVANYVEAICHHKDALEMYHKLNDLDNHLKWIVSLQRSIASNHYNLGEYGESVKHYEEVKTLLAEHSGKIEKELEQMQAICNNLGNSYKKMKNYPKAKENLEMALGLAEMLRDAEPGNLSLESDVATSENNIGCMFQETDEFEKAVKHHEQALRIRERICGEHVEAVTDIPSSLHNLGNTHFSAGSYNDAVAYYKKEIQALQNLHENTREAKVSLSRVYEKMGRLDDATDCLNED
ncbi:tetratricopeptide repeat protein 28-like isoform X2 [Watersipora subatra]|uniref:tetratricopeptide repeat protein 28-like isoform X2 n=1 Tax=Watersipora subatra TaxID=2589382 RepID=UPI00355C934C